METADQRCALPVSGQWMTERRGGSDVGQGTETVAVHQVSKNSTTGWSLVKCICSGSVGQGHQSGRFRASQVPYRVPVSVTNINNLPNQVLGNVNNLH